MMKGAWTNLQCRANPGCRVLSLVFGGAKINSSDPPLPAVGTVYATQPFLPFLHPPIELASFRPRGHFHLNRRVDLPAICLTVLARISMNGIELAPIVHGVRWDEGFPSAEVPTRSRNER